MTTIIKFNPVLEFCLTALAVVAVLFVIVYTIGLIIEIKKEL